MIDVANELARLGIALNAEQAAAWKGITLPKRPDPHTCDECRGKGTVPQSEWVSNCERDFDAPCSICEGTGRYLDAPARVPNFPRAFTGD